MATTRVADRQLLNTGIGSFSPSLLIPTVIHGNFPNGKFPSAYTTSSVSGYNDIYSVPAGKKALISDFFTTNVTGSSTVISPNIKISSTYYRLGSDYTENNSTYGHNYGMSQSRSAPIILNEGETFSINSTQSGVTFWLSVVEFDQVSPLNRADIRNWISGDNTLITVPTNKTISIGGIGHNQANNPGSSITGLLICNNSGSSRSLSSVNLVPFGDSPNSNNTFITTNTIFNTSIFSKYMHGNLNSGDYININLDHTGNSVFAWINYIETDLNPANITYPKNTKIITFVVHGDELGNRLSTKVVVPFNGYITKWNILSEELQFCQLDVKKNDISISPDQPYIDNTYYNSSNILTAWDTFVSEGDIFNISVEDKNSTGKITLQLVMEII